MQHNRYLILICTLFTAAFSCNLAAQNLDWATIFSSDAFNSIGQMTEDSEGNIIIAGQFNDSFTIDDPSIITNIGGNPGSNIFFAKLTPSGQLIWLKALEGNSVSGAASSVTTDSADNIYLTGSFDGTLDFDPGQNSEIHSSNAETVTSNFYIHLDVFIAKYNTEGALIWVKIIGGDGPDLAHDIAISDSDSLIFISGEYDSTLDFNPSDFDSTIYSPIGYYNDAFIACYTTDGELNWAKGIGANFGPTSETREICTLSDGSIIAATATAYEQFHFYPDSIETNDFPDGALVLTKISNDGEIIWNRILGGPEANWIRDIKKGVENDFYISGTFEEEIDFWPENSDVGYYSNEEGVTSFVARFDYNGNYLSSSAYGNGELGTFGYALAINSASEIYVAGRFHGTVDLNPGEANSWHTASSESSPYLLKLDSDMNYLWSQQLDGTDNMQSYTDIFLSFNSDLVISGVFESSIDLDPNPATYSVESFGELDGFVVRHKCTGESEIEIVGCNEYTLPFSQNIVTESGTYTETFTFDDNCSHTSVIDVEILNLNSDVIIQNDTLYSLEPNTQYNWFDCNNPEINLPNSNDQNFVPPASGSYAVELISDSCTFTTSCINYNPTSIEESNPESSNCWPNPTNSSLFFETEFSNPEVYSLYNIHGSMITSGRTVQGVNELDISHLQPGVYIFNMGGSSEKILKY